VLGYVKSERKEWQKIEKRELKAKLSQGISEESKQQLLKNTASLIRILKEALQEITEFS
jgi:hypothetical protein